MYTWFQELCVGSDAEYLSEYTVFGWGGALITEISGAGGLGRMGGRFMGMCWGDFLSRG